MKKIITLLAAMMMVVSLSGFVFAADYQGKVTKVKGKTVTIEITKGKAAKLAVGSKVEIKLDEKASKPKKSGNDMMQGC
ncbi:MAG: hypothetical protein QNK24_07200 [Desulfuromusa sp.]|nr:hypothetical protein [Desulfuromusa sp.]